MTYNLGVNRNEVKGLPGQLDEVYNSDSWTFQNSAAGAAILGGSLFGLRGYRAVRTDAGELVIGSNGLPQLETVIFDDVNNQIIASKRNQLVEPFMTVSTGKLFEEIFRESLVLELAWEEKIEYKIDNRIRQDDTKKISFFTLIRKYLSKKIRTFFG